MRSFKHVNARTVDEVRALLADYQGKAILHAGGTEVLSILKGEYLSNYPEAVINIKTLSGLDEIREERGVLKIGALTKLSDITKSPLLKSRCKALVEAAIRWLPLRSAIQRPLAAISVRRCVAGTIGIRSRSVGASSACAREARSAMPSGEIIVTIPSSALRVSQSIPVHQIARPMSTSPLI